MADEYLILDNPTSTPAAVSTGYQRQNSNMVAGRVGEDRSIIEGGVGQVTVKIAGPTDVNGVLYVAGADEVLTPASGAGRYYVRLTGSGSTLTPALTQDSGTFDPANNGRYDGSSYRVLNWVIDYDGTDCIVERWVTPEEDYNILDTLGEPETVFFDASGTWVAPRSKYYNIWVTAPGQDGGAGGTGGLSVPPTAQTAGSAGGAAGISGFVRQWADAGESFTVTINISVSRIQSSGHNIYCNGPDDGDNAFGVDQDFPGGSGGRGGNGDSSSFAGNGSQGGASIWGSGGVGGLGGIAAAGAIGGNAGAYGSGGGSGGGGGGKTSAPAYSGGAGGNGATGIIAIIG